MWRHDAKFPKLEGEFAPIYLENGKSYENVTPVQISVALSTKGKMLRFAV